MIVYCDTSALVKLYILEMGSEKTNELRKEASILAACRISWAEMFAALARRTREHPEDESAIAEAGKAFRTDWPNYLIIDSSQDVVEQAGQLASAFALRGYDSVQLASALLLQRRLGDIITFACFDNRLNVAANLLGMHTPFLRN